MDWLAALWTKVPGWIISLIEKTFKAVKEKREADTANIAKREASVRLEITRSERRKQKHEDAIIAMIEQIKDLERESLKKDPNRRIRMPLPAEGEDPGILNEAWERYVKERDRFIGICLEAPQTSIWPNPFEHEFMSASQTSALPPKNVTAQTPLLEVRDLKTYFSTDRGTARAVDGVSFSIPAGSTLGLVGESGCGKSVSALSILRLIPSPPGEIVGGSILFEGRELLHLNDDEIRQVRGNQISMVFQEPMTSLNPVFTLGDQIEEAILVHEPVTRAEATNRAVEMLRRVKIPYAETLLDQYPHQISGGMRQRVMIAMALVCRPKLLIADEPTTALDVTIQAQILELLEDLQAEFGMSILIITHDLGIVSDLADAVAVMYAGQIVEYASTMDLFTSPRHPYTLGLFHSRPQLGKKKARLDVIPGTVPSPLNFPSGCRFHSRCAYVADECRKTDVSLDEVAPEHTSRCLRVQKGEIQLSKS